MTWDSGTFLSADERMRGPGKSPINMINNHDNDVNDAAEIFKRTLKFP